MKSEKLLPSMDLHGSMTLTYLFFAGNDVQAQKIYRLVGPHDIAATISAYLQIKPPSGSVGIPLKEVLKKQ